jgi:hypothetical protein
MCAVKTASNDELRARVERLEREKAELEQDNARMQLHIARLELEAQTLQETLWASARLSSRPPPEK